MTRRKPAPLPPPTDEEREVARAAAAALRLAIAVPSTRGEPSTAHLDFSRPRRSVWTTTWANLPGFTRWRENGTLRYTHTLLPGWEYCRAEIRRELIPDLEALAERGERPTETTSPG